MAGFFMRGRMAGMSDITYSRREHLHLPPTLDRRTRFYSVSDRTVLATIQFGVLFVMAFWSGPARQAFEELKRVLEAIDTDGRLELVVVDTDGCEDLYHLPEFAKSKLTGAGETAWIRAGKIIQISHHGYHPECFEPYTRQLLDETQTVDTQTRQ
jgi:hypothetical protein